MMGQTLTQKTESRNERKVFITAYGNFSCINIGDVIELGEEKRPELITHKIPIDVVYGTMSSIFRMSPKSIFWVERLYSENHLDSYTIKGRFNRDSIDIAEQRTYQTLDQLLNKNGII